MYGRNSEENVIRNLSDGSVKELNENLFHAKDEVVLFVDSYETAYREKQNVEKSQKLLQVFSLNETVEAALEKRSFLLILQNGYMRQAIR